MLESMTATQLAEWQVWVRMENERVKDEMDNPPEKRPKTFRPIEEMRDTMRKAT
jgi:hypothetical protein